MNVKPFLQIFGIVLVVSAVFSVFVNFDADSFAQMNYQIFGTFPESDLSLNEKIDPSISSNGKVEVIVELTAPVSLAVYQQMNIMPVLQSKGTIKRQFSTIVNAVVMEVDADKIDDIAAMRQVRGVYSNEPIWHLNDYTYTIQCVSEAQLSMAQIQDAWDKGFTGKKVAVAIVDSGIDSNHPDLKDKIVYKYGPSLPDGGHGTACAGIVASIAPDAVLLDIHAFYWQNGVVTSTSEILIDAWQKVYDWSLQHPDYTVICSNSWGSEPSGNIYNMYNRACETLVDRGIAVVCAAGNDDSTKGYGKNIEVPGACEYAFCCAATDSGYSIASFSSRGPGYNGIWKPDISGLGVNVYTTRKGGGYMGFSGTSAATPYVAGCMALLSEAKPDYTPLDFYEAFKTTAFDLGANGWDVSYGWGFVQVDNAIKDVKTNFTPQSGVINYGFMVLGVVGIGFVLAPRKHGFEF